MKTRARYKRIPQKIGRQRVMTAHRELMDLCEKCGKPILSGMWYVLKKRQPVHYFCTKSKPKD